MVPFVIFTSISQSSTISSNTNLIASFTILLITQSQKKNSQLNNYSFVSFIPYDPIQNVFSSASHNYGVHNSTTKNDFLNLSTPISIFNDTSTMKVLSISTHHMITRGKERIFKPKKIQDTLVLPQPKNYK